MYPAEQQRREQQRQRRKGGEISGQADLRPEQQIANHNQRGIGKSAEQREHHRAALLDGRDLIRPVQIRHLQPDEQAEGGHQQHIARDQHRAEQKLCGGKRVCKCQQHIADRRRDAGEREVDGQLGPQHLPRLDGQRLREPEALALERDGGRGHIVHRGQQADRRDEQQ